MWHDRGDRRGVGLLIAIGLVGLVAAVPYLASAQTQEGIPRKAIPSRASKESSKDDTKLSTAALEKKLNAVLANQQTILEKFDAIMEELRIIKVRVSIIRSSGS